MQPGPASPLVTSHAIHILGFGLASAVKSVVVVVLVVVCHQISAKMDSVCSHDTVAAVLLKPFTCCIWVQ